MSPQASEKSPGSFLFHTTENKASTMATLSKQGIEIARFDHVRERLSYRSNGAILVNNGSGWRISKKYSPEETRRLAEQQQRELDFQPDERKAFNAEWCRLVPLSHRFRFWPVFNEFFRSVPQLRAKIEDRAKLFAETPVKLTDKELERLASLYTRWCIVRETVVFAIEQNGNEIATLVQGPQDFRREVAKRVQSFGGRGVKIRAASLVEIQVYTAAGNTIETPQNARSFGRLVQRYA